MKRSDIFDLKKLIRNAIDSDIDSDWEYIIFNDSIEFRRTFQFGDDFIMDIKYNTKNPVESFIENINKYYFNFNEEDYILAHYFGKNGFSKPLVNLINGVSEMRNAIKKLIEDFENILYLPFN